MLVRDLMTRLDKGVSIGQPLAEVWRLMKEARIGAVPVTDEDDGVMGLVHKDDMLDLGIGRFGGDITVREFVRTGFPGVPEDAGIEEVCSLPYDIVPVIGGDGKLKGVLTREAVRSALLDSAILMIDQLIILLDSVNNGIIAVNGEGIITLFNKSAESMIGKPRKCVLGRHLLEVIGYRELLEVLKDGRRESQCRLSFDYSTGRRIYLTNQSPVIENGRIVGAVGVLQDITEIEWASKELDLVKRMNRELECIIESSSDGILITDSKGNIIRANRAHEHITGFPAEDIEGKNMQELVEKGVYSASVVDAVLRKGEPVTVVESKSDQHQLLVTGNPIYEHGGEIARIVINVQDLTELNRLAYELEKAQRLSQRYLDELTHLRTKSLKQEGIVFKSPKMQEFLAVALRVAQVDSTVLISGESGVGKEVIARLIHNYSKRKDGPFITVNCGAIPENLLESELFGYEPGAFTGASREGKIGLFELADKGTLFLDEIAELPLPFQVKLLRAIQEKKILPVGGTKPRTVDFRIVAASNRDLERLVGEGRFREDLYFRLNVVPLHVPPLRERKQDIIPLAYTFRDKFCKAYGLEKDFAPEVFGAFLDYDWPGNVRELENLVERLVVTSPGDKITLADLPQFLFKHRGSSPRVMVQGVLPLREAVVELEMQLIQNAIREYGSTYKAAKALHIDQSTLARKAKKARELTSRKTAASRDEL